MELVYWILLCYIIVISINVFLQGDPELRGFAHICFTKLHIGAKFSDIPTSAQTRVKNCGSLLLLLFVECICAGVKRVYVCTHIQGGSDISGTISERHRCIKNSFF
jgi:hypothetical protein